MTALAEAGGERASLDRDRAAIERLIRIKLQRFGQSQAYWYDAQTGASAWSICADGEGVRW